MRRFCKGKTQIMWWNCWLNCCLLRGSHRCGRRTEETRLHGIQDRELHCLMKPGFSILTVSTYYSLYSAVTIGFELSDWSFQKDWMLHPIVWTTRTSCLAFWLESKSLARIVGTPFDAIDEHQRCGDLNSASSFAPCTTELETSSIQASVIWKKTQQAMEQETI